jgi:hypothetical protein
VHFYASGDGFVWNYIGNAVTDDDGYAYMIYVADSKTWFKAEFMGDEFYEASSEVVVWDPGNICRPLVVTNVEIFDKVVFCVSRYGVTVFILILVFFVLLLIRR